MQLEVPCAISPKESTRMAVASHTPPFHLDDLLSISLLSLIYNLLVTFTRDPEVIKEADLVIDVGFEFSPEGGRYDHHQREFEEKRMGVRYASAGLVWKFFGEAIIRRFAALTDIEIGSSDIENIIKSLDLSIFQHSDKIDNHGDPRETLTASRFMMGVANPPMGGSEDDAKQRLGLALSTCRSFLCGSIQKQLCLISARPIVSQACEEGKKKGYVVMDEQGIPWANTVQDWNREKGPKDRILFAVFPRDDKWRASAISKGVGNERWMLFPEAWGGLERCDDLPEGVYFCHKDLFIIGADSKEAAIAAVEYTISAAGILTAEQKMEDKIMP